MTDAKFSYPSPFTSFNFQATASSGLIFFHSTDIAQSFDTISSSYFISPSAKTI
jgi:hypothetical protein